VEADHFHANPQISLTHSHWGLWDEGDVVELFLAPNGNPSLEGYFEFQVSPKNQFFTLRVFEPRKRTSTETPMPFEHTSQVSEENGRWTARMRIPLAKYEWNQRPELLTGGLFAILGAKGAQTYWAAFLPEQKTPDYHLPAFFQPLLAGEKP
jgi:hypothetical protein